MLDSAISAEPKITLASDTSPTSLLTSPDVAAATSSASAQSLSVEVPTSATTAIKFLSVALSCVVAQAILNGTVMQLPMMRSVAEVSPYLGDSPWTVASLLGWKVLEIAVGWFGGFQGKKMVFEDNAQPLARRKL